MATVDDRELALGPHLQPGDPRAGRGAAARPTTCSDELRELAKFLDGSPEFEQFLASPLVDDEDRARALERAFRGRPATCWSTPCR